MRLTRSTLSLFLIALVLANGAYAQNHPLINDMRARQWEARSEVAALDAKIEYIRAAVRGELGHVDVSERVGADDVTQLSEAITRRQAEFQEIQLRYGPQHPDFVWMRGQLAELRTQFQAAVERHLEGLAQERERLVQLIEALDVGIARAEAETNPGAPTLQMLISSVRPGCEADLEPDEAVDCMCSRLTGSPVNTDLALPVLVAYPTVGTQGAAVTEDGTLQLVPLRPTVRIVIDVSGTIAACGLVAE